MRSSDVIKLIEAGYTKDEIRAMDEVKTDPVKTDPVKTDPVKTDPVKTDPVKTDPVKTDPVKTDKNGDRMSKLETQIEKLTNALYSKNIQDTNGKEPETLDSILERAMKGASR